MSGFEVVPSDLQTAGAALDNLRAELAYDLAGLVNQVAALLGAGWRGQAASGFAAGWAEWRSGAEEMLQALGAMGQLLGVTGGAYRGTDTNLAAGITGVERGLA